MKSILALLTFSVVAVGAQAQTLEKQIASCAAITSHLERLECYDQLARKHSLNQPQSKPVSTTGVGKWRTRDTTNPIDDSRTVVLTLAADGQRSRFGEEIRLVLRCQSNETEVYINWNDFLGSEAMVTTRIGAAKATTSRWGLSTDKKASFYPDNPVTLIQALLDQSTFVAQVTPYAESPVTATFDLTGLAEAVKPLRQTCQW